MMNIVACFHAYKFTHYADTEVPITNNPEQLSIKQKIIALLFGVDLPRPKNNRFPTHEYETVYLANRKLECWEIKVANPKGTVLLFHGYGNKKCAMIDRSDELNTMGYNTVLMDFSGSGGSAGNCTTIGFKEGEEVKLCFEYYYKKYNDKPIYLLGTSMGAAAIMKCMNDHKLKPQGVILECPFGSMHQTVCNRFEAMGVPSFPMAGMLVLYGGLMNGFWAFDHNPIDYAKKMDCPTLLMCGGSDERVSQQEIEEIYNNLQGEKQKIIYPKAKHESYLNQYAKEWTKDVSGFLEGK